MTPRQLMTRFLIAGSMALALNGCVAMPVVNKAVPEPARAVDIQSYKGLWYEIGRYENSFEKGCEAVTAEYQLLDDGMVSITNSCRKGSIYGSEAVSRGKAKVVAGSQNAKLKVSFFGPFYVGNYWVLDHAEDYSWAIVGEPSGRYLWLLSRSAQPSAGVREAMEKRTRELGYDWSLVYATKH